MSEVILDASALLALLNEEPGAEIVTESVAQAAVCAVNFSEVAAKLSEGGMPEDAIREALEGLGLDVVPFDRDQAYATGFLRSLTKPLGLGLGDRACLALAKKRGLTALRADRTWEKFNIGINVQVIR
jgi:ribonuclease VapC